MAVRTFVRGLFCLIVYTRRQKSAIITETRWEFSCLYMRKTVKTEWISDNATKGLENGPFLLYNIPYSILSISFGRNIIEPNRRWEYFVLENYK